MKVSPPGSMSPRDRAPHAGELFTDRESESQAFKVALARFRRALDGDDDAGTARHNVLTFYGLGGIGKTTLSERLEAWIRHDLPLDNGWGFAPATTVDATARLDLHSSAGQMDVAGALLALRAGVAGLRPRWPVFDLAFAAYWSAIRPGEPLPDFRAHAGFGDMVSETVGDLLNDLGSAAELATGAVGGLGLRGVRKLIEVLRRRRDLRLAVEAFDGFEDFLMKCADEPSPLDPRPHLACDIAAALSWELAQAVPAPLVTVFIDTTERLALDPRRVAERHLNTLIYNMPNVLFVMTGREMIDWYDEGRVDLPHRGRRVWPGLVPGALEEPRQHLVGNLSPADTKALVLRGRRQLDLPMTDAVADELVKASSGLPQYLELARQIAVSIKDSGQERQIQVEDVTGSLGSLVERILDDVPADEQRAIRASCLFRVFDTEMMAAAADVDHGCAERAVTRPMIDRFDGERFPYRTHDAVREAIRRSDSQVVGGWSERDWEQASSRAAAAARRLHDEGKQREDVRGVLDAVGMAVTLVCDQNTDLESGSSPNYADWLTRAIVFGPSIAGLRDRIPTQSRTEYGRHVLNFITAKSVQTPITERLRLLKEIFDSAHPLRLPAGRHLGYTLKLAHRWDEAIAVFEQVVQLAPTPLHLGQPAQVLGLSRRFADAADAAQDLPVQKMITRLTEYAHGRPERYFAEFPGKLDKLRSDGRQREYMEELGTSLERRALFCGDLGLAEVNELVGEAEVAGHLVALRSALVAVVLLDEDHGESMAALDRIRVLDQASTADGTIGYRYALAECCNAMALGDEDRLHALHREANQIKSRTRSWIPIECFLESAGLPLVPMPTQWLEQYETVSQRWRKHLHAYLARRGIPPRG